MVLLRFALFLFIVIFSNLFLISNAVAAPTFSSPTPADNSYIFGKDTDLFSVIITDSLLKEATAKLHIRVDDPTSTWANVSLSCVNTSSTERNCSSTVSGLSALVKDGDTLLFYFDAYNANDEYGSHGSTSSPLDAIVDRSIPKVFFNIPNNNGYAGGNATISINASDAFSGVDSSSVKYSFDNSTFKDTTLSGSSYINAEQWDTGTYSTNESVTIYAKAKDNVENENSTSITVFIDNEKPTISATTPTASELIKGTHSFTITASDTHAGINDATGFFEIESVNQTMSCSNGSCSHSFDTSSVSDGDQTVRFYIADKVGNRGNYTVNIVVDNNAPQITITSPEDGSSVEGEITVRATVTDSATGVKTVQYRWEKDSTTGEWTDMSCGATCSATLNTSTLQSGNNKIVVKATDNLSNEGTSSVTITVVNGTGTAAQSSGDGDETTSSSSSSPGGSGPGSSGSGPSGFPGSPSSGPGGSQVPPATCGNNACEASESCGSCEADCGKCALWDISGIRDAIMNSPLFDTEEKRIITSTGLLSLAVFVFLLFKKFKLYARLKRPKKPYKT